jgi:hypothetical protein
MVETDRSMVKWKDMATFPICGFHETRFMYGAGDAAVPRLEKSQCEKNDSNSMNE